MAELKAELHGIASGDQIVRDLLETASLDSKKPLSFQIFEILKNLILTMQIRPGQALSEQEIAEVLNASKTPVREALIRLENAQLVKIVPKSGTYVAPLNVNRYLAACFTRLHLEIGAIRAASANPERHSFDPYLDEIVDDQIAAEARDDYEAFFNLDEKLHQTFFEIAKVPDVWKTVQQTQTDVYRVRHLRRINNIKNGPRVIAGHKALISAMRDGDADRAQAAMVAHIGPIESKIKALVDQPDLLELIETLNKTRSRTRRGKNAPSANRREWEGTCQA